MTSFTWGGDSPATWGGDSPATWGEGRPLPPENLVAEAASESEIELEWDIIASIEETIVYRAREESADLGDYDEIATVDAPTNTFVDAGLTNGREYHYRVTSSNAIGESEDTSNNASGVTELPAPEIVSLEAEAEREIEIEWLTNDDNDEGNVTIRRDSESIVTAGVEETMFTDDDGVLDGEEYNFDVVRDTTDATATSDSETVVSVLPDADGLVLDASEENEITASWAAVLNNGEFRLEFRDDEPDDDHPDYEFVADVAFDDPLEETVGGLLDGEQYSFRLRTQTEFATGEWLVAEEITKITAADGLAFENVTDSSVTATWTDNSDFRGSYQIWRARSGYEYDDDLGRLVKTVDDDATTADVDGFVPGREYDIVIRAQTQWVMADSEPATVETLSGGFDQSPVPSVGAFAEIDHPAGKTKRPDIADDVRLEPTVNGFPRLRFTTEGGEQWHSESLDDAPMRFWQDGKKQPIDALEHRDLSEADVELGGRGGLQLERQVTISEDGVFEVSSFVEGLLNDETDYEPVVDDFSGDVREDVLLLLAEIQAELQSALEDIPDDVPLEYDGDALQRTQTSVTVDGTTNSSFVSESDDYSGGEAGRIEDGGTSIGPFDVTFDHDVPEGEVVFAARAERIASDNLQVQVTVDNEPVFAPIPASNLGWLETTLSDVAFEAGESRTVEIIVEDGTGDERYDLVTIYDGRYEPNFPNELHESGGFLPEPHDFPGSVEIELEEINTPLAIAEVTITVTTDDGLGVATLALRQDGTGEYDSVEEALTYTVAYEDLEATAQGRIGLGRARNLDPQEATPRFGYQPQRLESIQLEADLDETPIIVNPDFDDQIKAILNEAVGEFADGNWEVQSGDPIEVHVARIDGRPSDIDPDLIDYSVDRQTEDVLGRARVYAGAESIRRLPFEATVDEWTELPLPDGRIVDGSAVVFDADDADETPLSRGDDYLLETVQQEGPPRIQLLAEVERPRLDCDFQPRGEATRADAGDDPRTQTFNAPELSGQQMADIAAFQAVEGAYTDVAIDATLTFPPGEIGFDMIGALNVSGLPGDRPYQQLESNFDAGEITVRLGSGQRADDIIGRIRQQTDRTSKRV